MPTYREQARALAPEPLGELVQAVRHCRLCEAHLPLGPNPIIQADSRARIALVSQAPGRIAHVKSLPYQDPSGRRLRDWLGVDEEAFYRSGRFVILPMGFCYPGKAGGGDAPPRPECAPTWHARVWSVLPGIELAVLIGGFAQAHYLAGRRERTLTATVRRWRDYLPDGYLPVPHPSPLNNLWLRRNPWYEEEVVPALRARVAELLAAP